MSPRNPFRSRAGNDSTSVAWSCRRNSRFNRRSSRSPVTKQVKARPRATSPASRAANSASGRREIPGVATSKSKATVSDGLVRAGIGTSGQRDFTDGALRCRHWIGRRERFRRRYIRRSVTQTQSQLPPIAGQLLVALIRLHDFLHQAVTHHVAFVEIGKTDALDAAQNFYRVGQSAALASRQIDLCQIAGYYHLGVESLARQHHLHLLGSAVLRFIQDDKAVVQGAAAHERYGRHFDHRPLQQL